MPVSFPTAIFSSELPDLSGGANIRATVSLAMTFEGRHMGVWDSSAYASVVICKNKKVHGHVNVNAGHKIPLAETDAFRPPRDLGGPFMVLCDECGKEYSYEPDEVLRLELELPRSFKPPPLFQ